MINSNYPYFKHTIIDNMTHRVNLSHISMINITLFFIITTSIQK
jgi:hypothetical protein